MTHNAQVLLVRSVITQSENLVNSDWSVNLSSHENALQQRATVVTEGIITNSDWLKSKFIAFLANQMEGNIRTNKLKESDFWES